MQFVSLYARVQPLILTKHHAGLRQLSCYCDHCFMPCIYYERFCRGRSDGGVLWAMQRERVQRMVWRNLWGRITVWRWVLAFQKRSVDTQKGYGTRFRALPKVWIYQGSIKTTHLWWCYAVIWDWAEVCELRRVIRWEEEEVIIIIFDLILVVILTQMKCCGFNLGIWSSSVWNLLGVTDLWKTSTSMM